MATPRLVFLYGPPAVGKLTVARAIAARLPFKILHNHLSIDPVAEILPFGTDGFWHVAGQFRRNLVSAAAAEGTDLIYTYVFAPGDEQHVTDIVHAYEQIGGRVLFVQLIAPREVLLGRVVEQTRTVTERSRTRRPSNGCSTSTRASPHWPTQTVLRSISR